MEVQETNRMTKNKNKTLMINKLLMLTMKMFKLCLSTRSKIAMIISKTNIDNQLTWKTGLKNSTRNIIVKIRVLRIIKLVAIILAILDKFLSTGMSWFRNLDGAISPQFGSLKISNMELMSQLKLWNQLLIIWMLLMTKFKYCKKSLSCLLPLNGWNQSANIKIKSLNKFIEMILMS